MSTTCPTCPKEIADKIIGRRGYIPGGTFMCEIVGKPHTLHVALRNTKHELIWE